MRPTSAGGPWSSSAAWPCTREIWKPTPTRAFSSRSRAARATLVGQARPLEAPDLAAARTLYLARHPEAAAWVDFDDFAFWRLEVAEVYFVGGFAAMDWVGSEAYGAERPDPLAEGAAGIMEHMNRDHGDALLVFARVLGGISADAAEMVAVDRLGFRLRIR